MVEQTIMTVECHSCHQVFADYGALALHIASSKKGHRKGKRWAAKYLVGNKLRTNRNNHNRTPLTEQDRENKRNTVRELSGEIKNVPTVCPQCHQGQHQRLPIEYVKSNTAWKIRSEFVVICNNCGR
jgi:predicted HNH restriction endonuclease